MSLEIGGASTARRSTWDWCSVAPSIRTQSRAMGGHNYYQDILGELCLHIIMMKNGNINLNLKITFFILLF